MDTATTIFTDARNLIVVAAAAVVAFGVLNTIISTKMAVGAVVVAILVAGGVMWALENPDIIKNLIGQEVTPTAAVLQVDHVDVWTGPGQQAAA